MTLESDAAARLRSLGYVGRQSSRSAPNGGRRSEASRRAERTVQYGADDLRRGPLAGRARRRSSRFCASGPDFVAARTSAATVLLALRPQRATPSTCCARACANNRGSPDLLAKLGAALRATPATCAARPRRFEQARAAGDDNPDVAERPRRRLRGPRTRIDDAARFFAQLIDRERRLGDDLVQPRTVRAAAAGTATRRSPRSAARPALDPSYGDAWHALGAALVDGDTPGAIDAWRHAERLLPRDYDLLFNLGMLLADSRTPVRGDSLPAPLRAGGAARPLRERHRARPRDARAPGATGR